MIRRLCLALTGAALIAALGACHSQQKAGHGEVSGQILPGSVSDAMLPYDTVKSKAPLAPQEAVEPAEAAAEDNSANSADTTAANSAAADVAASPAPAAPDVTN